MSTDTDMASASTIVATLTDVLLQANARVLDFGNCIMNVFHELATDSLLSEGLEPVQVVDVDVDELMEDVTNAVFGFCYAERWNRAAMISIFSLWNTLGMKGDLLLDTRVTHSILVVLWNFTWQGTEKHYRQRDHI